MNNKSKKNSFKAFSLLSQSTKTILGLIINLASVKNTKQQINNLYNIKDKINTDKIQNIDNIEEKNKLFWLNYSKTMDKKSNYASLYLFITIIWIILNILFVKKLSFLVVFTQLYFFCILLYYFLMCRYRSYQGLNKSNQKDYLSFGNWLKNIFKNNL